MKRLPFPSLAILLLLFLGLLAGPGAAQIPAGRALPAERPLRAANPAAVSFPQRQFWHIGPMPPFQYQRHDAVFVPGPEGTSWANRVYFMGGRISAPAELPDIWVFDPVTGIYTDTLADMIEDVSNYNSNLILDDGLGMGPAIYVVGGTDKDGGSGGGNIGMVQRYYPQFNYVEQLPPADDWPGTVGGYKLGGVGTAVVDDLIYVFGGWQTNSAPYFGADTWVLDPQAPMGSRWTNLEKPLAVGRSYIQVAVQDGKIYAMGGIYQYVGGDLVPTDAVEVLDTTNLAAGWQPLSPLPWPIAEGRGFGLDSDTLGSGPPTGRIYLAGGGDWPAISTAAFEYIVATDTWDETFPDLNEARVNNAGTYIPIESPKPNDGLPGIWTFGGRSYNGCDPPFGATEYYPFPVEQQCAILLVDDDWDQYDGEPYNGAGAAYYTATLEALGYAYDYWDGWTQGDPALANLAAYDVVIWFTGYAYEGTITATNEADLAAYLAGGGNLLLSSADYFYEMGLTDFARHYLGVDGFVGDTEEIDLVGTAGDPLGDGLGPYTLVVPTSWPIGDPTLYTDQVTAGLAAGTPFYYEASGAGAGASLDAYAWRTVFLPWPFEGLDGLSERTQVLDRVLDWFCYAARVPEVQLLPPFQAGAGAPGTEVTYTLQLLSKQAAPSDFTIAYDSAWPMAGPAAVGPVAPGALATFVVTVTVPAGLCLEMDVAVVTATSLLNPALHARAVLETTADPGTGALAGTVWDANTGLGIAGAHVTLTRSVFYSETWTAGDGGYRFAELPACDYAGGAAAAGYTGAAFTATVFEGLTTTVDLTLTAGWPDLSPGMVVITLTAGETGAFTLTLANTGTADLEFAVTVLGDAPWLEVAPYTPTVAPGESVELHGLLDTAGLPPAACYTTTLHFTYDDPYVGEEFVPVALCVLTACDPVTGVEFAWTPLTATVGEVVTFTAVLDGTPTPPITYTWDFGDGAVVVTLDAVVTHIYTATGVYSVTLAAANACGQAEATHLLIVEQVTPPPPPQWRIYLPVVVRS